MPFLNDLDVAVLNRQFEKGYLVIAHELSRYGAAYQSRKFFGATGDVLMRLHRAVLVAAALGLYWNNELPPIFVDANVNFIDFDLADIRGFKFEVQL